jgi:phosphoserine phosphatase
MAKRLGFTGALGTKAETENGIYTGKNDWKFITR